MKAYIITEAQMKNLRERLELVYHQRIATTGERPRLAGSPSWDAYASMNLAVCRWMSDMGADHYDVKPRLPEPESKSD